MSGLSSQVERADRTPGAELLQAMADELDALYSDRGATLDAIRVTPDDFTPPEGAFIVLRAEGEAVACGGVRRFDAETAEIKRMFVVPAMRGRGVARALLARLEQAARDAGYVRARLDTGTRQPHAATLYASAGYERIPDYNGNPYADAWFEKRL